LAGGQAGSGAEKYGAIMMVDDAHATACWPQWRGSVDHFNAHASGCAGGHAVEGDCALGAMCAAAAI